MMTAASFSAPENKMYPWEYVAWFVILVAASEAFVCLDLLQLDGAVVHWLLIHVDLSGTFLNLSARRTFYGGLKGDIKAKNSSAEKTPQENGDDEYLGR